MVERRVGFIHLHLMLMQNIGPRMFEMNEHNVDVNVAITIGCDGCGRRSGEEEAEEAEWRARGLFFFCR